MRIVGGNFGGRVLKAPAGADTRPTSEKVREALFNILAHRVLVDGAHVLDLCAGSGGLALEAISRGAAHATLVEKAKPALTAIRENVAALGVGDRVTIVADDAVAVAARPPEIPWRIVFVDPPYRSDVAVRAGQAVADHVASDGIVVIEHDNRNVPPDAIGSLLRTDRRRYGDTSVSFFTKEKP